MVGPLPVKLQIIPADAFSLKAGPLQQPDTGLIVRLHPCYDPVKAKLFENQAGHLFHRFRGVALMVKSAGKLITDLAGGEVTAADMMDADRSDDLFPIFLLINVKPVQGSLFHHLGFKDKHLLLKLRGVKVRKPIYLVFFKQFLIFISYISYFF